MDLENGDAEREYAAAFDDDMRPVDAMGDDGEDDDAPEATPALEPGQSGGGTDQKQAVAVVLNEGGAEDPANDIEKERQRLKSWEGRLKAREAEMGGRSGGGSSEAVADQLDDVAEDAAAGGNQQMAEAASAAAEAVEAGELSPEEAMKQLAEDFGDDFVKMVTAVVKVAARKEVEPFAKTVDQVVTNLNSREAREHFSAISSKHPDFQELGKSGEFASFIDGLPGDLKAEAERIKAQGSAKEVIALIDAYKESKAGPAQADSQDADDDMESMEGVRSGGVRLPEKPAAARDDFAGAWEEF